METVLQCDATLQEWKIGGTEVAHAVDRVLLAGRWDV
jgi:hypothetical protein